MIRALTGEAGAPYGWSRRVHGCRCVFALVVAEVPALLACSRRYYRWFRCAREKFCSQYIHLPDKV